MSYGSRLLKSFSDFTEIILHDAELECNVYYKTTARLCINGLMLMLSVAKELFAFSRFTGSSLFEYQSKVADTAILVSLCCVIEVIFYS